MKRVTIAIILMHLLGIFTCVSQEINNYKYINIPEQFGFQKEVNSYQINELTAFLFNKYQFEAFLETDVKLQEFSHCEVLKASMERKSGFTTTKIKVILKNCKGQVVYTSPEGQSIKKDYKKSYHEAIRGALKDPLIVNHKYIPNNAIKKKPALADQSNVINKPKPVRPIIEAPKAKVPEKKPLKKETPQLLFELRGKQYAFQKIENGFLIFGAGKPLGKGLLLPNKTDYELNAGNLSGKGSFDDYGNFILKRINPVNKKPITDIMARIN